MTTVLYVSGVVQMHRMRDSDRWTIRLGYLLLRAVSQGEVPSEVPAIFLRGSSQEHVTGVPAEPLGSTPSLLHRIAPGSASGSRQPRAAAPLSFQRSRAVLRRHAVNW